MDAGVEQVTCEHCGCFFSKDDLKRSCANCFACMLCEIYICPNCKEEIVVIPMKKIEKKRSNQAN